MKDRDTKSQLVCCIESLLKVRPMVITVLGKDFFSKEYALLEDIRERIDEVDLSEPELKRIQDSTLNFFKELKKCFLYGNILKCILN